MSEEKSLKSPQRRAFFKKAGLGAGAAVVAGAIGADPQPASAAAGSAQSQGYRETDHVKRVYELAKF